MSTIMTAVKLRIDIFHLTVCFYLPCLDGIIVIGYIGAMCGHQGVARRLDRTSVVGSTTLQYYGSTAPLPRHAEARQRTGQHRSRQHRLRPGLPAISRHFDLL